MAISNQLNVSFNHEFIDDLYDFYIIMTSDKFINGGAYILDKPIEQLKAESVVFDNGRSLFLMFKKNIISKFELINQLIDEKLTIKQVASTEIKDYILFRLFLFSINNFEYEENKFNNITGKLFITKSKWISKNKKTFKALNINVDEKMCISAEAATFTQSCLFKDKKILSSYPKYAFSNKNGALKRSFGSNDESYIKKSLFGNKAEICFFDMKKDNITNNKVYYIYKTLDLLKTKFKNLISFEFRHLNIIQTIGKYRDEKFIDKCKSILKGETINIVNWSNSIEYSDEFDEIVKLFKSKNLLNVNVSSKIDNNSINLIYLHNKEYYEQNKYKDPYLDFNKNIIIQHITIEDVSDKLINDNEAVFNSILKEIVIKLDIIKNNIVTIDNWNDYNFDGDIIFGREKNSIQYFMILSKDGSFKFKTRKDTLRMLNDEILDKCSNYLSDNKGKEKSIIADDSGNIILISRTGKYTLPSEKILSLETISRSKESRELYLDGVVDINLFANDGKTEYNSCLKGSGINTSIPKASIIYSVDLCEGENFISNILETMAVPFVKYKSFTVMPYPFKYINEYIEMIENNILKNK